MAPADCVHGPTRRADVLALGVPGVAAVILTLVVVGAPTPLTRDVDLPLERDAIGARGAGLTDAFRAITWLGNPTVVTIGVVVLGALVARREWRLGVAVALLAAARAAVSWAVKAAVDRPRPVLAPLEHPGGASFPSGHALGATVLWGAIALLAGRFVTRRLSRLVAAACAAIVLAVMTSRVYLGVHWPTDVVGGGLFGLALLGALRLAVPGPVPIRREEQRVEPS